MSAGDLMFTDDMMVTDGPAYRAIPEDEFKQIQDQIATLTRQRDLAVEALERLEHSFDFGEIAGIEPEACVRPKKFITNILSAIKESEAMAQGEKK